jgi:hypothetical protein
MRAAGQIATSLRTGLVSQRGLLSRLDESRIGLGLSGLGDRSGSKATPESTAEEHDAKHPVTHGSHLSSFIHENANRKSAIYEERCATIAHSAP